VFDRVGMGYCPGSEGRYVKVAGWSDTEYSLLKDLTF
jgi:hypothetical protein